MLKFDTIASSSEGCCYLLSGINEQHPLLIDCGVSIREIRNAVPFPISHMDGCLISHRHLDHCKAAIALTEAAIGVYASRETLDAIAGLRAYRTHELIIGKWATIREWTVLPFATKHDCDGALGFVIGSRDGDRLLYMTDTCYSPQIFTGLTHIAVECNHSEGLLRANADAGVIESERFARTSRTHMSIERLEQFLDACDLAKVQQVWLLHLSDSNSDEAGFKSRIQRRYGIPVEVAQKSRPRR